MATEAVSIHDWSGHQLGCLVASVTEHQTLISRTLLGSAFARCSLGIYTLRNVGTLGGKIIVDEDVIGVKDVVIVNVTNFSNGIPHNFLHVEFRLGRDFATYANDVTLNESLASNTRVLVLQQTSVQNSIRNCIGNLIGMTFANRFGGENIIFTHEERTLSAIEANARIIHQHIMMR